MKVSIWDLDYYYRGSKRNVFNPDVQKISSYHKQLGDKINFVVTEDDIHRPYDLYYIIKEKQKTPNPPSEFYLDKRVRWWGAAMKMRINWKMPDAMLGCRPDYLIYPETNTPQERAEQIRFLNRNAKPLTWRQDWTNEFKRKQILVTDDNLWNASKEDLLTILKEIAALPKVSFLEMIWLQKIICDEDIKQAFLNINFHPGVSFKWSPINLQQWTDAKEFILTLKKKCSRKADVGTLIIDYRNKQTNHWESRDQALSDYAALRQIIIEAKTAGIKIEVRMPTSRHETPYFELFESLALWTKYNFHYSFLEFITLQYGNCTKNSVEWPQYWNSPQKWTDVFRDLLRQSYMFPDFLCLKWLDQRISDNEIPWQKWKEEFKNGI